MTAAISAARARALNGPTEGFCDATTTVAVEYVDLSRYIGKQILIGVETNSHYIAFVASNAVAMTVGAAAVGTVGVPHTVNPAGATPPHIFVVPKEKHWLAYRTVSGAGLLRLTLV